MNLESGRLRGVQLVGKGLLVGGKDAAALALATRLASRRHIGIGDSLVNEILLVVWLQIVNGIDGNLLG